ncbi:hypothetical protein M427DRAFT_410662 [Gonapodya prolifera JEL478]|uniref:Uncharacterized protein n=1 Tax=Gonapodya prolifera (strain JEL478) TaxID=1344416 RepID=A0A139A5R6_GONPJ|nr:hypothetical protein M427DRAFT_410662 [Gonapodya prolifera JEL478]|eukprot:KXS12104.1 hypothetical protein M427DRAFT_410662 [Gonapodya prolifera JEL478]
MTGRSVSSICFPRSQRSRSLGWYSWLFKSSLRRRFVPSNGYPGHSTVIFLCLECLHVEIQSSSHNFGVPLPDDLRETVAWISDALQTWITYLRVLLVVETGAASSETQCCREAVDHAMEILRALLRAAPQSKCRLKLTAVEYRVKLLCPEDAALVDDTDGAVISWGQETMDMLRERLIEWVLETKTSKLIDRTLDG